MNTTIIIRKSETAATGYEIVDNNNVIAIESTYPGEPTTLVLPTNSANRKYFSSIRVDKANGEIEVPYKETKKHGPRENDVKRNVKPIEDYLEGDDRTNYLALLAKGKAARAEANKPKPMSELEKARRAKERADAKLKEAEASEAAKAEAEKAASSDKKPGKSKKA